MKTISKTTKLSLEKFQIAKLNNLNAILGGANAAGASKEEDDKNQSTTDTWTTTFGG